jgi:hypothetical protein
MLKISFWNRAIHRSSLRGSGAASLSDKRSSSFPSPESLPNARQTITTLARGSRFTRRTVIWHGFPILCCGSLSFRSMTPVGPVIWSPPLLRSSLCRYRLSASCCSQGFLLHFEWGVLSVLQCDDQHVNIHVFSTYKAVWWMLIGTFKVLFVYILKWRELILDVEGWTMDIDPWDIPSGLFQQPVELHFK